VLVLVLVLVLVVEVEVACEIMALHVSQGSPPTTTQLEDGRI
jgi:hypothetical protein